MRICLWWLQTMFSLTTLAATYLPLVLQAQGKDWQGLSFGWWAIIGVTLFAVSLGTVIARLWWNLRHFISMRGRLELENLQLEVGERRYHKEERDGPSV